MSKSAKYWEDRFNALQDAQMKQASKVAKDLDKAYKRSLASVERDILTWYQRIADNNQITLTEARELLTQGQLKEFKWTVEEYIKYGKENALDPKYLKELENASARVHIRRLEAIQLQIQHQVEVIHAKRYQDLEALSTDIYTERYYRTAYDTQLAFNIGWNIDRLDQDAINTIIRKPWAPDGVNFSSRIWSDRTKMVKVLHTELTQSIIRGDGPRDVISKMAKTFNTSKNIAGRLVMTEAAFLASAAQRDAFKELDVEEYKISATLDLKTSDICQDMDGEVFDIEEYAVNVTAPPFHAWCRTTTVPFFVDNYGERAARGEDGSTYYVPNDMTYKDWKKVYVDKELSPEQWLNRNNVVVPPPDPIAEKFRGIYQAWDGSSIKAFAMDLVSVENPNLKVSRKQLSGANGLCQLKYQNSDTIEILTYELNSLDTRPMDYQVKTAFHELFHAKSDGLVHGIGAQRYTYDFKTWAYYDDVFAESWAHHMAKEVGVIREIAPSYASHLIDTLPKLKAQVPDFKDCNSIADFGAVAQRYRFGSEATANWDELDKLLKGAAFDKISYSKQYVDYIEKNAADLVDKMLENMPNHTAYRNDMIKDLDRAVSAIKAGNYPTGNEKVVFDNVLIMSMSRLGVN